MKIISLPVKYLLLIILKLIKNSNLLSNILNYFIQMELQSIHN